LTWIEAQLDIVFRYGSPHSGWADHLKARIQSISTLVMNVVHAEKSVTEVSIASMLGFTGYQCDLFIGNSLIVRLFDMFAHFNSREVYSNRGASGIDGIVATAVGVQTVTEKPLILFMGDTSLLYDLNSMALLTKISCPFVLVVVNNDGGAIFDLLPVAPKQKTSLYQCPHGFDFQHAADQFGLHYECVSSLKYYQTVINNHILQGVGGLVIEVKTPNDQAAMHIRTIMEQVHAL